MLSPGGFGADEPPSLNSIRLEGVGVGTLPLLRIVHLCATDLTGAMTMTRQEIQRLQDRAKLARWGDAAKAERPPSRVAPKPDPAQLSILELQLDIEFDARELAQ